MKNTNWWCIVGLLFLVSCGGRRAQQSFWDNTTGTYTIPSLKISYTVPSDIENWAITDIDGKVPEIKCFGVENSTGICIVIIEPDSGLKSVSELDTIKVNEILYEIIGQSPAGRILRFTPNIERGRYIGSESWNFRADVSITDNRDTVNVSYTGHIFNSPNQKVAGIVSVAPTGMLDSIGIRAMDKYFNGVRFVMNN